MNRPRVVHIVPALFGQGGVYGGAERYALELARHMARMTPTKLVSFGKRPQRITTSDGLQVQVLAPPWYVRGQRLNPLHVGLARTVAEADVVHAHQTYILAAELSALLGRLIGRRVFTTNLGGGGWCLAARVQTAKWFQSHLHISQYSRGIAGHDVQSGSNVIYGGVDTEVFFPDPAVPREPLVVFVGRLMPHKGVDDLLAALPPGLILELIGRPYDPRFQADLKGLAANKPVVFRPEATDADVIQAYRRALCVVLPSVYRDRYGNETRVPELLGQTPLEGMACGTPAVVTAVASLPEVVAHGQTGFVVPPNDPTALGTKLQWLRDHQDDARRMGEAGRRRVVEMFTWDVVVRRCLAAYAGEPIL